MSTRHPSRLLGAALAAATLLLVLAVQILASPPHAALAAARTVTNCANDTELRDDLISLQLAGGGTLDFSCGPNPVTIVLSGSALPPIGTAVSIDGGGLVTLDANNASRFFYVYTTASLVLSNIHLTRGHSSEDGGAIASDGALTVSNVTFTDNTSSLSGGAIVAYGPITVLNSIFAGNTAVNAGALYPRHGSTGVVVDSTFQNNTAAGGKGGAMTLWDGPDITVSESRFVGNSAYYGGAIWVVQPSSALTVSQSLFSQNHADYSGGAILNEGSLLLTNVTLDGNDADSNGTAIQNESGVATLRFATVTGNDGTTEGGSALKASGGDIRIRNSIVALNIPAGSNCTYAGTGALISEGHNVVDNTDCAFYPEAGDVSADPLLAPLADNGGATLTRLPQANSPARNLIPGPEPITVDQRGVTRPQGGGFDAGAVELNYFSVSVATSGNGSVSGPALGIACPGTCAAEGPEGLAVTLSATPGAGQRFDGWTGACSGTGSCSFTLAADVTVGALFAPFNAPTNTPTYTPTTVPVPSGPTPTRTPVPTPTVTPEPPPVRLEPAVDAPPPAPVPAGVAATININPSQAYAGQSVTVSGQVPAGYTQVRILITAGAQTFSALLANVQNGGYSTAYTLPSPLSPQPLRLCAIVVGAPNAQMTCAVLNVVAAPPASIFGTLGRASPNASIVLLNQSGQRAYAAPLRGDGTFSFSGVAPGSYSYRYSGSSSTPVTGGILTVPSASNVQLNFVSSPCRATDLVDAGYVTADYTRVTGQGFDTGRLIGRYVPIGSLPFGIYVQGVRGVHVTFTAEPQSTAPPQEVIFKFYRPDGSLLDLVSDNAPPWSATFDVGRLPASSGGRNSRVVAVPVVDGLQQCTAAMRDILVIPNFIQSSLVRDNAITWDSVLGRYKIKVVVPNIPGVLPIDDFDLPPPSLPEIPFYGRFTNGADAGIAAVGWFKLDGALTFNYVNAFLYAKLLDVNLIGPEEWKLFKIELETNVNDPAVGVLNWLREKSFPFPLDDINKQLPEFYVPTPFLSVPVASFFGLIDLTVHGQAGYGASFTLSGYIKPLKPEVSATFTPKARADAELGVGLRVVQGLAEFGATARVEGAIRAPITVVLSAQPSVDLQGCLELAFKVRAFAQVLWGVIPGTKYDETQLLASWNGCLDVIAAQAGGADAVAHAQGSPDPTIPSLIAAPQIAAAPDGRMLRAWSENTAAAGATPQIQILASLKPAGSSTWGPAVAVSNPAHSSRSPVVGFVGPSGVPVVGWVENTMTAAQATAAGSDLAAHLNKQEIVYSIYSGGAWGVPLLLTQDALADGLPAMGAGPGGAVLGWVRDTDGNPATRSDQKIAASLWNTGNNTFGPLSLLTVAPNGFSADVAAAWAPAPFGGPWLAWIFDGDADLVSADDRRIVVAHWDGAAWDVEVPAALPARADSPTLAANAQNVRIAFLVREPAADGSVPLLGTNGVLWTARFTGSEWSGAPVQSGGVAIYAEQPDLAANGSEMLLLFRRMGRALDYSSLGQLALSQIVGAGEPGEPAYLTDEPRQNWYGSIAVDPSDGQAEVVRVARALPEGQVASAGLAPIADAESIAAAEVEVASAAVDADPIEMSLLDDTPNLALDPLFTPDPWPTAGSTMPVTVRVRNLGRLPGPAATISLYTGDPASSTPAATLNVAAGLPFGEEQSLTANVPVPNSQFVLTAVLTPAGANASTADDRRTLALGQLTAPIMVGVQASGTFEEALAVDWNSPAVEKPDGFRVLRAPAASGPWQLVGETANPSYHDLDVARQTTYCYKVQAFHATGGLSPLATTPVCGTLGLVSTYLPMVRNAR